LRGTFENVPPEAFGNGFFFYTVDFAPDAVKFEPFFAGVSLTAVTS